MVKQLPLMPAATAVWLIDNTSLTFKQIAEFCGMHELEVKSIADQQSAKGIIGINPVISGFLTKEEILRCSNDPDAKLQISDSFKMPILGRKSKYIPLVNRKDKPDAIFWLLKNYPNIEDKQIIKLIGTTKAMVSSIKERTHWNIENIRPRDPVLLGLCTQIELDDLVAKLTKD